MGRGQQYCVEHVAHLDVGRKISILTLILKHSRYRHIDILPKKEVVKDILSGG